MHDRNCVQEAQPSARVCLLGDAIRRSRVEAGLTQSALGERMGAPQSVVSNWERGFGGMRLEAVWCIEVVLGLYPGELLVAAGYVQPIQPADDISALRKVRG